MTRIDLTNYLQEVRSELGDHPETEEIIHELNAHIWDYATNLSRKSEISVEDAFALAIENMEDPKILAQSFDLDQNQYTSPWMEPKSVFPEKKLSDRDFVILASIGFIAAIFVLSLIFQISEITGLNLGPGNFITTLLEFFILILLILAFFYFRDEREFKNQLRKLRNRFEKTELDPDELEKKRRSQALELHVEGVFEVIFAVLWLIGIIYWTFISKPIVFTDNWYNIVFYSSLILTLIEILNASLKVFVGQIRLSRLINGVVQIFEMIGVIIIVIFYPLNIEAWFDSFTNPNAIWFADLIKSTTSRPDYSFRIFLAIMSIFALMSAVYNLVKFGAWQPSHQKSLTIKSKIE